jgi:lipopolysaccharide/colanic/teichoic acid biosynthesis glycosyltransferase
MNGIGSRDTWRWLLPPIGDFFLFYLALGTVLLIREPEALNVKTALMFMPLFAAWIGALYTAGLYELRLIRDDVVLVRNLLITAVACILMGTTYFYALDTPHNPKTQLILAVLISHALVFLWRRTWLWLLKFELLEQRLALLGGPNQLQEIEQCLPHTAHEFGLSVGPWNWPDIDFVVADTEWVDRNWESARDVVLAAMAGGVPIVSMEDFYESIFGKVSPYYAAHPSWALEFILPKRFGVYATVKRGIDVVGSIVLLAAFAPALAATAALIAICDGTPIIFTQERVGLLGKSFMLWKFRTMSAGAEAKGPLLAPDALSSHVTRLGDILRRYRLDELPQLWNVLKGDISFVGPRPEWIKEVQILEKEVPSNHLRHLVKPGVTGWAQVHFRQTNTVADTIERLHYDLYYVKNWSFGLDVTIILKTIKRVLISDSTVDASPAPAMPMPNAEWVIDLTAADVRRYKPRRLEPSISPHPLTSVREAM